MNLSVNVMTRGAGERVAAMLSLFRGVADEILVALDDRAAQEVEVPLAAVADRVVRYPYADPVDRPLAWLHAECRGDWVLTIDDDEVPMQALLDALPALTRAKAEDVTHYWLPRRWLYGDPGRWLDARPWRPDYQPRLVLNDRRVLSFTTETHVPVRVLGPSRYLDTGFYHLDTLLNSREAREEKARRYERSHPGKRVAGRPLNVAFYLPELVDPPTAEVPPEDLALIAGVLAGFPGGPSRAEVGAATREDIDAHWNEGGYESALSFLEDVPPLRAGQSEKVDVLVENRSEGTWKWDGAIRLGSRWRRGDETVDGEWTGLPADIAPGASARVPLALEAPSAGPWTLEVDLVHEHVRWFDQPIRAEVDVLPSRQVTVVDPGTLEGLVDALEALDPEEEPIVVSSRPELAREFAGRIVERPEDEGRWRKRWRK